MAKGGIIGGGILLLIISIIGYNIPLGATEADPNTSLTIPVAAGICNSAMGQLGQAFSGEAVKTCSEWNNLLYGIYGAGMLGLLLIISGAVIPGKKQDEQSLEERYHKGEFTQGEFESKKSELKPKEDETSMKILKERYAKGEITKEEFDKMKKDLE